MKIARAGKFNEFDQKNGRSSLSAEYRFFDKKKGGGEISRRMITRIDAKENLTKENFP